MGLAESRCPFCGLIGDNWSVKAEGGDLDDDEMEMDMDVE